MPPCGRLADGGYLGRLGPPIPNTGPSEVRRSGIPDRVLGTGPSLTRDAPPTRHAFRMPIVIDDSMTGIDWVQAKVDLAADDFDNGRSPAALRRSFEGSRHVAFARDYDRVVGMARLLSDGVCNAYLLDVWTASTHRRQGIATRLVRQLADQVPGQHIGLQTDDAQPFYLGLGFRAQPEFMSLVVGTWLDNEQNEIDP